MASDSNFYGGTDAPIGLNQLKGGAPNVTGGEKWLSILAGGALAAAGVRRGGVVGTLAIVAGSAIASRGIAGNDPVKRLFQPSPVERGIARAKGWANAATAGSAVSIARPRAEVYAFWRDFENLPKFMDNLDAIEVIDAKTSVWHVKGPGGTSAKWRSIITEEVPGDYYVWDSPEGDVKNSGRVEFRDAPKGHGTEVHLTIAYEPPLGQFGRVAAKIARREPAIQARQDLKRFKMMLEAGEISTAKLNARATNAA